MGRGSASIFTDIAESTYIIGIEVVDKVGGVFVVIVDLRKAVKRIILIADCLIERIGLADEVARASLLYWSLKVWVIF